MSKFVVYFAISIPLLVAILLLRFIELIDNLVFLVVVNGFIIFLHALRKKLKISFESNFFMKRNSGDS
ncbi:hypothetical protein QTG56_00765 [Rossellomorea sp. AcN35-11]|nr:hypothetical protein [Rossellomorea aquimaris]WJV29735.1 hypothetical protein QTG56_00765 [Rossellomorea sp. AcN35-11]